MVHLTQAATSYIRQVQRDGDGAREKCPRLAGGGANVTLEFTDRPDPDDGAVVAAGLLVYLARPALRRLIGATIDTRVKDDETVLVILEVWASTEGTLRH